MVPIDSNPQSNDRTTRAGEPVPPAMPTAGILKRLVPAMLLTGLATLVIGWLAFLISRAGVAPVVLFPIAVGLAVGAAQGAILQKLGCPLPWFVAAMLGLAWGGLAVATEDYSGYRDYLGSYATVQRGDRLASILQSTADQWQPAGFVDYLSAVVRRNPVWWSIDAVLTPLAAAVVAAAMCRRAKTVGGQPPPSHRPI